MNTDIITHIDLTISEGKDILITAVPNKLLPRYYKVGNGIKNRFMGEHKPMDAIELLTEMTPQELWTIRIIKNNLLLLEVPDENGVVRRRASCKAVVVASELTESEKRKFQTGFSRLRDKNIVKRIKRQHYILNPNFFIPHFYNEELLYYQSLSVN
jgi:hypothetical protein